MANSLLSSDSFDSNLSFLLLDGAHLNRWRGHSLAQLGDPEAVAVLGEALTNLDPSFRRAETTLRVDLAAALAALGEHEEAMLHRDKATAFATEIGSVRQRLRIRALIGTAD